MANLLSELLGLGTEIPICFDQHCGEVRSEKIHIINIIPTRSPKPLGNYTHRHTPVNFINKGADTHKYFKVYESNSQYQFDPMTDCPIRRFKFTPSTKTIILL